MICPFRFLFGVPCPGCGLTRAWLAFFHGRFVEAFQWHPLFWLAPAVLASPFIGKFWRLRRSFTHVLLVGVIVLFLSVYTARMIFYFPDTVPMVYNVGVIVRFVQALGGHNS